MHNRPIFNLPELKLYKFKIEAQTVLILND